jgi:hypothetical protein
MNAPGYVVLQGRTASKDFQVVRVRFRVTVVLTICLFSFRPRFWFGLDLDIALAPRHLKERLVPSGLG